MSRSAHDDDWSLQAGIDSAAWPEAVRAATRDIRQGVLIERPPLVYAANAEYPVHEITRRWAASSRASSGAVNITAVDKRPPYGLVVTQTCDLVEEGRPKRPWLQVAPVYFQRLSRGDKRRILQGRAFDYLCPVTSLDTIEEGLWVADLRILIAIEKGVLVDLEAFPAFAEQTEYDRLSNQLSRRFSRPAYPRRINDYLIRPVQSMLLELAERYVGADPISDVGLALGRSRLDPDNAQVVFLLHGPIENELRTFLVDWWAPVAAHAENAGLTVLPPWFVNETDLSAKEYRRLDWLNADSLSPEDEQVAAPSMPA